MTDNFIKQSLPSSSGQSRISSWIIFLFPALALTTKSGVSFIEAAALLGAIIYIKQLYLRRAESFQSAQWILLAFACNFLFAVASSAWFGFRFFHLDYPVRELLAMVLIGLVVLMKPRAEYFWYGLFCGACGGAIFAFYQCVVLQIDRAYGPHQIIMFGDLAMAMGLMSLAGTSNFAGTRLAGLPYLAALAGLTASVLSGSRGGWLALPLAIVPLYFSHHHLIRYRTVIVIFSVLIIACFIPQLKINSRINGAVIDIHQYKKGMTDSSSGARFELWKGAMQLFSAHPLMGVGRKNLNTEPVRLKTSTEEHTAVMKYDHAHNEILNALATGGIIGTFILLFVYIAPLSFFINVLRRQDEARSYAMAGMLLVSSFIIFGLTQVMFAHHIGTSFYALSTAILTGLCINFSNKMTKPKERSYPAVH